MLRSSKEWDSIVAALVPVMRFGKIATIMDNHIPVWCIDIQDGYGSHLNPPFL